MGESGTCRRAKMVEVQLLLGWREDGVRERGLDGPARGEGGVVADVGKKESSICIGRVGIQARHNEALVSTP